MLSLMEVYSMTDQHPITPSPELVQKWVAATESNDCIGALPTNFEQRICTAAARWGADQELEACINHFHEYDTSWGEDSDLIAGLRAARRPKPPSLKERALDSWDRLRNEAWCEDIGFDLDFIRGALESLPD